MSFFSVYIRKLPIDDCRNEITTRGANERFIRQILGVLILMRERDGGGGRVERRGRFE